MLIQKLKHALLGTLAASALVVGLGTSPASAGTINFTWSPENASPALTSPVGAFPVGIANIVNATTITIQDFASIYIPAGAGAFTPGAQKETGYVVFAAFDTTNAGLTDAAGNTAFPNAAKPYLMVLKVEATGHFTDVSVSGTFTGVFDSLNYTLYGIPDPADMNGLLTLGQGDQVCQSANGTTCNNLGGAIPILTNVGSGLVTLAVGSLLGGEITLTAAGTPGANVRATFDPSLPAQAGFYVNPTSYLNINMFDAFTNPPSAVSTFTDVGRQCGFNAGTVLAAGDTCFAIHSGAGTVNFVSVPEPTSLSLFGMGLLGLGFFGWRRAKNNKQS